LERAVTVLGLCASWEELMRALVVDGPSALIKQVREAEAEFLYELKAGPRYLAVP
jgi:hypothetical protein